MSDQAMEIPFIERRRRTGFNRIRRFINNFWLIPVLFLYLQLSTQIIYSADSPLERLSKGNHDFIRGIPIAYKIATHDFPNTLIGHLYEMASHGLYKSGLFQPSHDDLKLALSSSETQNHIYRRMIASRDHHESEIGGILTISYPPEGAALHFYEITSLNEHFLAKLRSAINSPSEFIDLITSEENQEILDGVGIRKEWIENIVPLLPNRRITEDIRKKVLENFVEMYEVLSESRYLLSPYQLKKGLGKVPFEERFVGLYHFHNGLNQPPSPVDSQQSLRKRQIVMTFSEEGLTLYDVVKRTPSKIEIKIDKKMRLQ